MRDLRTRPHNQMEERKKNLLDKVNVTHQEGLSSKLKETRGNGAVG